MSKGRYLLYWGVCFVSAVAWIAIGDYAAAAAWLAASLIICFVHERDA